MLIIDFYVASLDYYKPFRMFQVWLLDDVGKLWIEPSYPEPPVKLDSLPPMWENR